MSTINQIHTLEAIAKLIPNPTTLNPHDPHLKIDNTGLIIATSNNYVTLLEIKIPSRFELLDGSTFRTKIITQIPISDPDLIPTLTQSITQAQCS